uniref:Uncharacterized protein n=1 Tax=Acrobeloides nanus TaxID=290746 RepID=A0A914CFE6_9BILA
MWQGMGMPYAPMSPMIPYQPSMTDPLLSTYGSPGSFYPPMQYQSPYAANMGYPGPRQAFDYGGANMGYPLRPLQDFASNSLLYFISDKDNFEPRGCSWDGVRNRCTDILNTCKGGCKDFAHDVTHDCRCVPFGYAALLG